MNERRKEIKPQPFILIKISKIKDRNTKFKGCGNKKKKLELSG